MVEIGSDDTFTLAEVAQVTGLPESTLYRWRWQGYLLTRYDYEIDPEMMQRIVAHLRADPANATKPLPGALPSAKFLLEDCVRMLVIGHLGALGWDRMKLFDVLAAPYAIHIEHGREPYRLVIFPNGMKLDRVAVATEAELHQVLAMKPLAVVIDLDSYRKQILESLARIIEIRERKTAAIENRARVQGRFVKMTEKV